MSFLIPSSPPSLPPPAPVVQDSADMEDARRKERQAARLRVGRAATILTGGSGLGVGASSRKSLLGE